MDTASIDAIAEFVDSRLGLEAMYVFGSEVSGRTHPESDLDLAVLVTRRPPVEEWTQLVAEAESLAGRDLDLVLLDEASPILARQVLEKGLLVRGQRSSRRAAFEAELLSRYEDLRRVRAPVERALIDRVRRAG